MYMWNPIRIITFRDKIADVVVYIEKLKVSLNSFSDLSLAYSEVLVYVQLPKILFALTMTEPERSWVA